MTEHFTVPIRVADDQEAEIASAEAWSAGAEGVEERVDSEGTLLLVYVSASQLDGLLHAMSVCPGRSGTVGPPRPVDPVDWSAAWREGLVATVISDRLLVRPSFVAVDLAPGQGEIVIDPGQAFGTGTHASTSLALEWIDALAARGEDLGADTRVLDVGTGTGILALAALRLGARDAVALDIDPLATAEALDWSRRNGLAERLRVLTGPVEALGTVRFDLVVANMLRSEILPLAQEVARLLEPGAALVLSGLLLDDRERVRAAFSPLGVQLEEERAARDPNGDEWVGLLMRRSFGAADAAHTEDDAAEAQPAVGDE